MQATVSEFALSFNSFLEAFGIARTQAEAVGHDVVYIDQFVKAAAVEMRLKNQKTKEYSCPSLSSS
jgi:hypothetical protein